MDKDIQNRYYDVRDKFPTSILLGYDVGDDRVTFPLRDAAVVHQTTGREITTDLGFQSVRVWKQDFEDVRRILAERGYVVRVEIV